ncbi:histidine phosphatase family protein [Amylibacter sp. SFDW26]|uniref:histidine phosphatase family protein n=1 Tax=Amylibacter sp. SFDW26 TaxID=2652722 RepID=UPI001261622E|nr:histidine phosphatase family protein [Amylibacter sp. SFDW26]KAB7613371.1 histidine phosphatase family protein [Amylibacter sp. SFDW26]
MVRVHLIRHGQASFGASDYDQLSDTGMLQGRILGKSRKVNGSNTVSGTLRRHIQTATAFLSEQSETVSITQDKRWNEFDYLDVIKAHRPDMETHAALVKEFANTSNPNKAFQKLYDAAVSRWASGEYDNDYTESRTAFRTRVRTALENLCADTPEDKSVYIFSSGGPISAVVQDALDLSEDATRRIERTMVNTGVTSLSLRGNTPRLITLNCHAHLQNQEAHYVTYR